MAYFGLEPLSASYLTDYFSGNNTTVAFTLSRAPVAASAVIITISGVKQAASTYGVSGTTLTFSGAPPAGTNNIEVLHLGVQPDTVVQPSYRTITEFTATSGQTTFSPASYTVGYIDVFRNGVKLGTADYTATNGTTVVLNNACALGDLVRFEGFLITSFNNAIPNTAGAVGSSLIADGTVTDAKIFQVSASKLTGSQSIPKATLPAGSVLQVVQANSITYATTTSSTYQQSSLTVTITPTSATSKVLVQVQTQIGMAQSNWSDIALFRNNTTNLSGATAAAGIYAGPSSGTFDGHGGGIITFLDSPATTSATIYTMFFRSRNGSGPARVILDSMLSTITATEIAG